MRSFLIAISLCATLAACNPVDKFGYPVSTPVDRDMLLGHAEHIEIGRAEMGPWCYERRGDLSPDARACVIWHGHLCTIALVPGLEPELKASLEHRSMAICKGWHPL